MRQKHFQLLDEKKGEIKWFLNLILNYNMAFLGETDRFLYFNKKSNWTWMTAEDKILVFSQEIWQND
jgi:hypothetical protein